MRVEEDELAQINTDMIFDATLPRTFSGNHCPRCQETEIVYFQSLSTRSDATMRLFYICANQKCLHKWSE